jgi:disulfide bond formation protein DsbB
MRILRHWPLAALIWSLAALAVAHGFETFGRMAPCELCLKERQVYWLASGVALAGSVMAWRSPGLRPWICAALGLIFLGGGVLAAYHAGVEWKFWPGPQECTGGHVRLTIADMNRFLKGGATNVPRCDKPAFVFLGLSMAGWNAGLSLGLAAASALATRFNRARLITGGAS